MARGVWRKMRGYLPARRRRAGRSRDVGADDATAVLESLQCHMESRFIHQNVNDEVIEPALQVIDCRALRAYDAIQLAGALVLSTIGAQNLTFVCSDHRLLDAARSENLTVFDPAAG